jgi:protein-S-isoprenylcysteine O-methyltransferase Ste14
VLVLVLLLDRLVIVREEARLGAQFGEPYLAYRRRIRRWC